MGNSESGSLALNADDADLHASSLKKTKPEYCLDIVSLSKSFRRSTQLSSYTTLKSALVKLFRTKNDVSTSELSPGKTQVLSNLTLRLPKGASVGIIGRNGSGKSTLLKLITGIYKPDLGSIKVNGRVAALIELGAGFHPDFTGRENLYLAGIMHGLTKEEVTKRLDDIVSFAGLESVLDDPVRTYSSGMFMRLGFSLAVHTDPDILLVDEVLAVGDAGFVNKCKEKISALRKAGKTLLLVSHDLEAVERWCDEVLWLQGGKVRDRGEPRRVIDKYRQFIEEGEEAELVASSQSASKKEPLDKLDGVEELDSNQDSSEEVAPDMNRPQRWGSREVEIKAVRLLSDVGAPKQLFHTNDAVKIEIDYEIHAQVGELVFGIGLNRNDGLVVHGSNTDIEKITLPLDKMQDKRVGTVTYRIERVGLLSGNYSIDVAAHRLDGYPYDYHKDVVTFIVRSSFNQVGIYEPPHTWIVNE